MIVLKIDVTKIDKAKLYKGQKGTYLSAVLIPTPDSQYGDYMIVQETTKEEREAGVKGVILGNGKNLTTRGIKPAEPPRSDFDRPAPPLDQQEDTLMDNSDLPFVWTILLAVGSLITYL